MKIGDRVIINPNIPNGAWSKNGYEFHWDGMRKPGVFTLEKEYSGGGFEIYGFIYDEEWLLPVPLFSVGNTVKIRGDLNESQDLPYRVASKMVRMAGTEFKIEHIRTSDRTPTLLGDDGYLYMLENDTRKFSWSSPMFDLSNYKLKIKKHESRLQEQESPLRGGSGEVKCGICCRKHKPRVTVKSVGYKEVVGRG